MKKVQKKVKTALQKKMGATKKKNGRKNEREKKRPFFLMGAIKKKEGQRPFFWDRFLGALLPNKPN